MSQTINVYEPHTVHRAGLIPETGNLEIVRRYPSNMTYGSGKPVPDRLVKEVYGVVDGQITLIETVIGKHEPAYVVPEKITFEKED